MEGKNTILIAALGLFLILVMGAGAVYVLFFAQEETVSVSADPFSNLFPFSDSAKGPDVDVPAGGNLNPDVTTGTISVRGLNGPLEVKDFSKGEGVAITVEGDAYYVVYPKEGEFSYDKLEYEVGYVPEEQRVYVTIYKEPIGDIRRKAAADLAERLALSEKDLCNLDALVIAPRWLNDYYADKNLGFPGCANGIKFAGD